MGTLYVVGVPMGSPDDVTLRALRVLRQASLIVAPDARRAQEFLAHYGIDRPLTDCRLRTRNEVVGQSVKETREFEAVLDALTRGDVALISEAEMLPSSGLTYRLVRAAAEQGIPVASVPGPSAAVTALVLSGLPANAFVCLGFLPQHATQRRRLLASLAGERRTLLAFEASGCLLAALRDVAETLGDRALVLLRAPVTLDGCVWRGTVQEAVACCEVNREVNREVNPPRGECTLVIGGATEGERRWPEARVRSELARLLAKGLGRKAAARQVAESSGWRQREVYRLAAKETAQVPQSFELYPAAGAGFAFGASWCIISYVAGVTFG